MSTSLELGDVTLPPKDLPVKQQNVRAQGMQWWQLSGRMEDAIDTLARNTSEERMKKVWEALLPLDLEPMVKIGAFRQLRNEEMASQFLAMDNDFCKLFILNFLCNV